MYIKEVNIDGFKSYAQRVCLTNFDPGFNAITGLNGSGKSNILDSLCFVMGIKNLSAVSRQGSSTPVGPTSNKNSSSSGAAVPHKRAAHPASSVYSSSLVVLGSRHTACSPCLMLCVVQVRAQNLQELVYKQGSAGITKATVSIVFHNNDPANGPSGYEDKEYITVTRQVGGRGVGGGGAA